MITPVGCAPSNQQKHSVAKQDNLSKDKEIIQTISEELSLTKLNEYETVPNVSETELRDGVSELRAVSRLSRRTTSRASLLSSRASRQGSAASAASERASAASGRASSLSSLSRERRGASSRSRERVVSAASDGRLTPGVRAESALSGGGAIVTPRPASVGKTTFTIRTPPPALASYATNGSAGEMRRSQPVPKKSSCS